MNAEGVDPPAEIRNRRGERLEFAWDGWGATGATQASRDVVILAHGVTSSFDRPYLVELGDWLARRRLHALRFSFSGNGGSEGRFEDATPTKELDDATSVVDALSAAGFTRIAWVGHSMGAAIGTMLAARDDRVHALVSLAGMFHVARFFERHFAQLPFGEPMLGKAKCPWSRALAEDAARIGSLHDAARRVTVPWLLVHGDADEMVPLQDSEDALAAGDRSKRLLVPLAGSDHRFRDGAPRNVYHGVIPHVVSAVVPWLERLMDQGTGDG